LPITEGGVLLIPGVLTAAEGMHDMGYLFFNMLIFIVQYAMKLS